MLDRNEYLLIREHDSKKSFLKKLSQGSAGIFVGFFAGVYVGYHKSYNYCLNPLRKWERSRDDTDIDIVPAWGLVSHVIHIPYALFHGLYAMVRGAIVGYQYNAYHPNHLIDILSAPTNRFYSKELRFAAKRYLHSHYGMYKDTEHNKGKILMDLFRSTKPEEQKIVRAYLKEMHVTNPFTEKWTDIRCEDFMKFVLKRCVSAMSFLQFDMIEKQMPNPKLKTQYFQYFIETLLFELSASSNDQRKAKLNQRLQFYFQRMSYETLELFLKTLEHLEGSPNLDELLKFAHLRLLQFKTHLPTPLQELVCHYENLFEPANQESDSLGFNSRKGRLSCP